METCFEYIDKEDAYFSSDERKWIARIRKLAEKFPDKVTILKQPEENDGCIYATLPSEYLNIGPKKRMNLTDEQIAIRREIARKSFGLRSENGDEKQHD